MARRKGGGWRDGPSNAQRSSRPEERKPGATSSGHRGVCRYFIIGSCWSGKNCKFSHDAGSLTELPLRPAIENNDSETRDAYLSCKRQLRGFGRMTSSGSVRPIDHSFWSCVVKVLEGEGRQWHQAIAEDLVDDDLGGPKAIAFAINATIADTGNSTSHSEFLSVMTHRSLLECLSISSHVGTMYRILAGSDGDQAFILLETLSSRISPYTAKSLSANRLVLILSATHELLKRERKCLAHDSLPALLETVHNKIEACKGIMSSAELDLATSRLDTIKRMAAMVRTQLLDPKPVEFAPLSPLARSTFPMETVIPGGKHDNDFVDICKIRVFPTLREIVSDSPEFLPTTDLSQPHFLPDPVQRHIDVAFRLLRHDTLGPLKDLLAPVLSPSSARGNIRAGLSAGTSDIKAHHYTGARIKCLNVERRSGLGAVIAFSEPNNLRNKKRDDRCRWWKDSARLEEGCLACFVSTTSSIEPFFLLLVVSKKTVSERGENHTSSLVSDHDGPSISVHLACPSLENHCLLTGAFARQERGVLLDLPGLMPGTFVPVLENLQRMMKSGELAFARWILPPPHTHAVTSHSLPPPRYARQTGFKFSLNSILLDGCRKSLHLDPASPTGGIELDVLESCTGLDRGQCLGLVAALTREYALIQGPPGTGKSYLGVKLVRILLDHRSKARLGPILIICYTNHALDQFLKHLLDMGIDKIIRIGGQSKTPELAGKNLRVVAESVGKTTSERRGLHDAYSDAENLLASAERILGPVAELAKKRMLDWRLAKDYLSLHFPRIAAQLMPQKTDEEGFEVVGRQDPIISWLSKGERVRYSVQGGGQNFDVDKLSDQAGGDIHSLTNHERRVLADSWRSGMVDGACETAFEMLDQVRRSQKVIDDIHDETHRRALLQAHVIGVTTTGLARNINMLRGVGPKVVICEEAAEVMEPHIMASLMPGVEHFIQIGDHRQLRPKVQNYVQFSLETAVGRAYQLDRSQFERRAVGEPGLLPLEVAQLQTQRRMRPEISALIRGVYPALRDHETVNNLPAVVGMRRSLFWLDHDKPEASQHDSVQFKSHSNDWEVKMATALVRHLVRQGTYSSTDIALLTPYSGQLQKLRAALSSDFEVFLNDRDLESLAMDGFGGDSEEGAEFRDGMGASRALVKEKLVNTIRLATVDNFQGEEAKVIVASLVRSNGNSKVGFLRTENRINVLLSRAQHGMFLIGNTKTYLHVKMWADVHRQLSEAQAVGPAIELCCPRHPETPIKCYEPGDFVQKSPEGGCALICGRRLDDCGHRCPAPCHSDRLHSAFSCMQPCPRLRSTCQHTCPKLCSEDCGPCLVPITEVELPCGHKQDLLCHQTLHLERVQCRKRVKRTVPTCGHVVTTECFVNVAADTFMCPTKCTESLNCGHICPGSCGRCQTRNDHQGDSTPKHQRCFKVCGRPLGTCNHLCTATCHVGSACPPCSHKCDVQCPHSRCTKTCCAPCTPCIEPCAWNCQHQGPCSLPCGAPCDRLPCDKRCPLRLSCGHQCPSFCGEECPRDLCQVCCTKKDARIDLLEFKTYDEVDLDESPIVALSCGHFFTGESLDGLMGMSEVYSSNRAGEYSGLIDITAAGPLPSGLPACPDCKRPVRQFATRRYNRIVNRAVMGETAKRFLAHGRRELDCLETNLGNIQTALDKLTLQQDKPKLDPKLRAKISAVYNNAKQLAQQATRLQKNMGTEHQPQKKLLDAIILSRAQQRQDRRNPETTNPGYQPHYDKQVMLGAFFIQLKAGYMIASHKSSTAAKLRGDIPLTAQAISTEAFREARELLRTSKQFVDQANDAKLTRLVIHGTMIYASAAKMHSDNRPKPSTTEPPRPDTEDKVNGTTRKDDDFQARAQRLLTDALALCQTIPGNDAATLRKAVEQMSKTLGCTRYEELTAEELALVKEAMVSGPRGIATHSGHWYNCENGHPFAIGECGMPMELARCPECGAAIGGTQHTFVTGVSRAEDLERA